MGHLRKWGAVWILVVLFIGSWVGQFVSQLTEVRADAQTHGEPFMWSDFWPQFFAATLENWQSEFLQLLVQAVLIASMIGQPRLFRADYSADKDDVEKILRAIRAERD